MAKEELIVDRQAAAMSPSDADVRTWAAGERVFISSVMASLTKEREAVASAIETIGAEPVWFENFGGRDQDATEAYLTEVASSTIYVGVLARDYGRILPPGFSATHAEYLEARSDGLRISVWVRADPDMEGHQRHFLDEVQVFHVTGPFDGPDVLAAGVGRRLTKMAAEALAPWCKLGSVIFRARRIRDDGATFEIEATVHDPATAAALENFRGDPGGWNRGMKGQFTHGDRSVPVEVTSVEVTTTSSRARDFKIGLRGAERTGSGMDIGAFRTGTTTYTRADLTEVGVRSSFFGEPNPLAEMRFMADVGDPWSTFRAANVSTEIAEPIARLLTVEALVGGGHAERVTEFRVGPAHRGTRRVRLSWLPARQYSNEPLTERHVEGDAAV